MSDAKLKETMDRLGPANTLRLAAFGCVMRAIKEPALADRQQDVLATAFNLVEEIMLVEVIDKVVSRDGNFDELALCLQATRAIAKVQELKERLMTLVDL